MSIKKTIAKILLPPMRFVLSELQEKQKHDEERKKLEQEEREKNKGKWLLKAAMLLIGIFVGVMILLLAILMFMPQPQGGVNATAIIAAYGQNPPVVIEIYSESCPYCQAMNKIITEFKKTQPKINIIQIEASNSSVNVKSFPTFVIVRTDGTYVKWIGSMGKNDFEKWVLDNYR